jgi:peroxiredoxin
MLVVLVAVALLTVRGLALGADLPRLEERPESGFLAPDFALPSLDGAPVKLSDFRDQKPVFLNFWASWCASCRREMPTMETLYRQFKARGLEVVAVSVDKDGTDVAKFVSIHGVTFSVLRDTTFAVARLYRVSSIPTHYFIDKHGVIRSREVGPKDWTKPETWTVIEELLR